MKTTLKENDMTDVNFRLLDFAFQLAASPINYNEGTANQVTKMTFTFADVADNYRKLVALVAEGEK